MPAKANEWNGIYFPSVAVESFKNSIAGVGKTKEKFRWNSMDRYNPIESHQDPANMSVVSRGFMCAVAEHTGNPTFM